jgi:DNA-binding XRE family transcriptional regulator
MMMSSRSKMAYNGSRLGELPLAKKVGVGKQTEKSCFEMDFKGKK